MAFKWQTRRVWTGSLLATAVAATLVMVLPSPVQADAFDQALAQIDEALETNPNGVSPESLRTCRAMRKTAVLLRKMGHYARAVRRLKACRKLLGLDDYRSLGPRDPGLPCVA
jgi:hypothetical protein